ADGTLLARLDHGEVTGELLDRLAVRVADFHRTATPAPKAGRFAVAAVQEVLSEARPQVGTTVRPSGFARLERRLKEALDRPGPPLRRLLLPGRRRRRGPGAPAAVHRSPSGHPRPGRWTDAGRAGGGRGRAPRLPGSRPRPLAAGPGRAGTAAGPSLPGPGGG